MNSYLDIFRNPYGAILPPGGGLQLEAPAVVEPVNVGAGGPRNAPAEALERSRRNGTAELTVEDVAAVLSVSAEFVRDHAAELGAARIGNPRTGPLRFRARGIDAYLEARRLAAPTTRRRRRPGPHRGDYALLPLPGRSDR